MADAAQPGTVTIDGKQYALADLSDNARAQITNLRVTDEEIARLQTRLAIAQTARAAYANALSDEINSATGAGANKPN